MHSLVIIKSNSALSGIPDNQVLILARLHSIRQSSTGQLTTGSTHRSHDTQTPEVIRFLLLKNSTTEILCCRKGKQNRFLNVWAVEAIEEKLKWAEAGSDTEIRCAEGIKRNNVELRSKSYRLNSCRRRAAFHGPNAITGTMQMLLMVTEWMRDLKHWFDCATIMQRCIHYDESMAHRVQTVNAP